MDNVFYIYLLSISAKISTELGFIGTAFICLSIICYVAVLIRHGAFDDTHIKERWEAEKERHKEMEAKVRPWSVTGICLGLFCWFLSALCPSTEDVLRAYALVEGSKVINAENAEHTAIAVGKRFDRFLDIIDKSINPRDSADNNKTK